MAASQEQKLDYLLKKIGYVASKTGIAEDSILSGTKKAPFGEAISSPLVVPSTNIWADSSLIPTTPPGSDTNYVKVYPASSSGFRMTVDSTVSGNRSFIARSIWGDGNSNNVGDWIDTQFGPDYIIKVYKGDPASGGVQLSAAGSGTNDTWFFDYSSGVLNFNGSVVPSGVTTDNIYIVGYRYIGAKGARPTAGLATFTSLDVSGLSTFRGLVEANSGANIDYIDGINLSYTGIGTITRLFSEDIQATGVVTASNGFVGDVTGNADTATALETSRTFQITGDIVASAISFDGTGNVSLAATIQPNSVALGDDTTGNYVATISGTTNEIEVTGSGSETASVTVGLPNNVVISNDLQVNNDTVIQGNLTVYGTETIVNTQSLNVFDKDIILGIGTENGETDDTANGGGIAIASTEGSPIVCLQCGVNTLPGTYKQLLWLKNGTFAGLATDAWVSNYAVSIGSTIIDFGSRLAVGDIQFTDTDIKTISSINASGIITANTFSGNLENILTLNTSGIGLSGSSTFDNSTSNTFTITSNATSDNINGTLIARDDSGNFSAGIITATFSGNVTGDVTGNADTATALETPRTFEITGDIVGSAVSFDGTGNVSIAATIQPNSVALGDDTTGNYVATISGTAGEVEVSGSGSESAAVTIGLPDVISVGGVNATGIITANTFSGSGASLTSIPNSALDNSSVSFGGVSVSLGSADATPAFDLTDATGLPISTGVSGLGANVATFLATPSSSNLASAITDETGSGSLVFSTNPTLDNPTFTDAESNAINVSGIVTTNRLNVGLGGTVITTTSLGKVGINTTNPTTELEVSGTIKATDFDSLSDKTLKENIRPITNSLEKISSVNGVSFDWKHTQEPSIGVIAQEVEQIFPELVHTAEYKSVNYNGLIGVLIEAVKELKQEVDELKRTNK